MQVKYLSGTITSSLDPYLYFYIQKMWYHWTFTSGMLVFYGSLIHRIFLMMAAKFSSLSVFSYIII